MALATIALAVTWDDWTEDQFGSDDCGWCHRTLVWGRGGFIWAQPVGGAGYRYVAWVCLCSVGCLRSQVDHYRPGQPIRFVAGAPPQTVRPPVP